MAIAGAVVAVGTAGYQVYQAEEAKSASEEGIRNFNSQSLENPYKDISISTVGSDQQTDANLSNFATSVDALQRGGTNAVLGGIPRLTESNILLQNRISAEIDEQDKRREVLVARGEENIRAIREGREALALQGLGQQLQTARQDSASGVFNLVSGGLSLASAINNRAGATPVAPATPTLPTAPQQSLAETPVANQNTPTIDQLTNFESIFGSTESNEATILNTNPLIFN